MWGVLAVALAAVLGVLGVVWWRRSEEEEGEVSVSRSSSLALGRAADAVPFWRRRRTIIAVAALCVCLPVAVFATGHLLWYLEPVDGKTASTWWAAFREIRFLKCQWVYLFGCGYYTPRDLNCHDWSRDGKDTPQCCRDKILTMLFDLGELLDEHNLTWWMDASTLLGAVRYGRLIPWETDGDIIVLLSDADAKKRLYDVFDIHLQRWRRYTFGNEPVLSIVYSGSNKNHIDVAMWTVKPTERNKYLTTHSNFTDFGDKVKWDVVFPLKHCFLHDRLLPCPNKFATFLLTNTRGASAKDSSSTFLKPKYPLCADGCEWRRKMDEETVKEGLAWLQKRRLPNLLDENI
jgi:LicD family